MDLFFNLYIDCIPKINDFINNKENKIKIIKNNFTMIFTLTYYNFTLILDIYDSQLNKWFYFVEIFDLSNENYDLYEEYYKELLILEEKEKQAKIIKEQEEIIFKQNMKQNMKQKKILNKLNIKIIKNI